MGGLVNVHNIKYASRNDVPSLENPSMHLRYEMDNNGSGVAATGKICCLMGRTEGGDSLYKTFAASGQLLVSTDVINFGTIRNKETFFTNENHRMVELVGLNVYIDGNTEVLVEGYKNMPLDGNEVYSDITVNKSVVEIDFTGEFVVDPAGSGLLGGLLAGRNLISNVDLSPLNIQLAHGETFSMVLRRTKNQSYTISSFLTWRELY